MDSSINGLRFVQKMNEVQEKFPSKRIVIYHDSLSEVNEFDGVIVLALPVEITQIISSTFVFEEALKVLWIFNDDIVILYVDGSQKLPGRHVACRQHLHLKISMMLIMDQHEEDFWRSMVAFYEFRNPTWI